MVQCVIYQKISKLIIKCKYYSLFRNMINVGAMDCHSLEHQEYNDRIRVYSQRLHQQWNNVQHPSIALKGLAPFTPKKPVVFVNNMYLFRF